jgi:hypothetical protein
LAVALNPIRPSQHLMQHFANRCVEVLRKGNDAREGVREGDRGCGIRMGDV